MLFYADRMENPVLEAMAHLEAGNAEAIGSDALMDRSGGMLRAAGPGFSGAGVVATAERRLPGDNQVRVSFANGNALAMPGSKHPLPLAAMLASAHARRAATYSISLSGTLEGTGTRWHASYRWQPEDTVTQVAPFSANAAEPFFNLHLRQPIFNSRQGTRGLDVIISMHNLLAEGFRPYVLSDGSVVMFAQDQRRFSTGLAFTF